MTIKLLIIDDHPAIVEGYKSILSLNSVGYTFEFFTAQSCEEANNILRSKPRNFFDLIFLDVILPVDMVNKLCSGEDVAVLIRKISPESKLIMLTSHTEAFVLYNISKKIYPDGLLVKSDFSGEELLVACQEILRGNFYKSATVKKSIKDILKRDTYLDSYNRQIISLLGQGIKTKNLPDHLNLSISAIDKRKAQIKDFFEIEKGNDEDIIRAARKSGFI